VLNYLTGNYLKGNSCGAMDSVSNSSPVDSNLSERKWDMNYEEVVCKICNSIMILPVTVSYNQLKVY